MRRVSLLVVALTCAACSPLWPVSSAPPTTRASHHVLNDRIDLTQGVALAIACRSVWSGMPCENLTVTSDDPAIATVSFVHLDKYRDPMGHVSDPAQQRSAFLVAGVAPGRTRIRVGGNDADEVIDVFVTR